MKGTAGPISDGLKKFIFEHVDSVELIEVLFLLRSDRTKVWTPEAISAELRSNPSSVLQRLRVLRRLQLVRKSAGKHEYRYDPKDEGTNQLLDELLQHYLVQRHKILEMIFSPMKKARDFAEAFRVSGRDDPDEDDDG